MKRTFLLAQINPSPGHLAGNAQQIAAALRHGQDIGAHWVLCPELALMGYPIRDVIVRHPFLVDDNLAYLRRLAEATAGQPTRLAVGFVEPRTGARWGKPFYNALAILGRGQVEAVVRKRLLPAYNEFNDPRTYASAPVTGCQPGHTLGQPGWEDALVLAEADGLPFVDEDGLRFGFSICEDLWSDPCFFDRPLYDTDPVAHLMARQPDVLINVSASPSRARKDALRLRMLSHTAQYWQRPLIYVNQVGAVDECVFDGLSRVLDAHGRVVATLPAFETAWQAIALDFSSPAGQATPVRSGQVASQIPEALVVADTATTACPPGQNKRFQPDDPEELARLWGAITLGIRDYFAKVGFSRAVLGLSGGLDSALCAALLAEALGPANVLAVSMPTQRTPDINREEARQLAEALGIGWLEIPIAPAMAGMETWRTEAQQVWQAWGPPSPTSTAPENVQAMVRASCLRQLGNDYAALPIATSDKSELYLGYATVNGDMSGALAPVGDVMKTQLRALGFWHNARQPSRRIPEGVLTRPPSADLAQDPATGQNVLAEAVLMPYAFADEVIWRIETLHQSPTALLHQPMDYEAQHPLDADTKRLWLDRFFTRMAQATFKWWVAPPILLVAGNGAITKTDYHHPITASHIDWFPSGRVDIGIPSP